MFSPGECAVAGLPAGSALGESLGSDPDPVPAAWDSTDLPRRSPQAGGGALRRESILRVVTDLVEAELAAAGSRGPSTLPDRSTWHGAMRIREGIIPEGEVASPEPGLALDSLDLLLVASRVNQFFHMQEWALGEHLIRYRTFATWAQVAHVALTDQGADEAGSPAGSREVWTRLTFTTSGSTGQPKEITRSRQELEEEVAYLRSRLSGVRRVVSLVPSHHLYGFLWTVLLPDRSGWESVDARFWSPGRLRSELRPGDLIVGFPLRWKVLLRTLDAIPPGVMGVSSAGALDADIWDAARARGLERLIEIYGSTETGGVGWRESMAAPYDVFPSWSNPARDLTAAAMDRLEWTADGRFRVLGRKDRAVKVGGELVDLSAVETILREHPEVLDCAVRIDDRAAVARLRAFVVPRPGTGPSPNALSEWVAARAHAAAVPRDITLGAELPRNAQGKVTAW